MIIPGFSKYNIEEDGTVRHVATGVPVSPYVVRAKGLYTYKRVALIGDDGSRHVYNLIRLLALAFLDKPEGRCVACPKDGDNLNTVLSNVEWVQCSTKVTKAWRENKMANRRPRTSKCCNEDSIAMIYEAAKACGGPISYTDLSYELDVPYSTVRYSGLALIQRGMAKMTKAGFEVIV